MRAVEELVNAVRDTRSRQHLLEATRAYGAGAFKSAIVSLWVAVAADLVAKIRQLADQGEPAAVKFTDDLNRAIELGNPAALMKIEQKLLDVCRDDYEFIDARDHTALERLREDRHICAHPAFVSTDALFEPTAELVRAHLATAVDAVLAHGPTAGRKAIARFETEIQSASWPQNIAELGDYLRERYLNHGKHALRVNLAKVIVKACIRPPQNNALIWTRSAAAARALDQVAPQLLAEALQDVIGRAEEGTGLNDAELICFVSALGDLDPAWSVIPATSLPRFTSIITSSDLDLLVAWSVLSTDPAPAAVAQALEARRAKLGDDQLTHLVALRPTAALLPRALDKLATSRSFRTAEARMSGQVLPLANYFTTDDVECFKTILEDDTCDVRYASGMPALTEQLYEATRTIPGTQATWEAIATYLETSNRDAGLSDYYAYPELAARVRGTG